MGGLAIKKWVPERVERSGPGSFRLNQMTGKNARPGDDVPGIYGPAGSGTTATPTGGIPKVGEGGVGGTGGAVAQPGGNPGAPGFTNTAAANPDLQAALEQYRQRITQQQAREGQVDPLLMEQVKNLRERMSADQTQRATERAGSNIRDFAAGQRVAADEAASRMGRPQGYRNASIDEAAQRAQAKASADIQMGQQQRLDALTLGGQGIMSAPSQEALQREAGVTNLIAGLGGQAGLGADLALRQQGLGLSAWQTQQQLALEQQRMAQQNQLAQQQMLAELMRAGYY